MLSISESEFQRLKERFKEIQDYLTHRKEYTSTPDKTGLSKSPSDPYLSKSNDESHKNIRGLLRRMSSDVCLELALLRPLIKLPSGFVLDESLKEQSRLADTYDTLPTAPGRRSGSKEREQPKLEQIQENIVMKVETDPMPLPSTSEPLGDASLPGSSQSGSHSGSENQAQGQGQPPALQRKGSAHSDSGYDEGEQRPTSVSQNASLRSSRSVRNMDYPEIVSRDGPLLPPPLFSAHISAFEGMVKMQPQTKGRRHRRLATTLRKRGSSFIRSLRKMTTKKTEGDDPESLHTQRRPGTEKRKRKNDNELVPPQVAKRPSIGLAIDDPEEAYIDPASIVSVPVPTQHIQELKEAAVDNRSVANEPSATSKIDQDPENAVQNADINPGSSIAEVFEKDHKNKEEQKSDKESDMKDETGEPGKLLTAPKAENIPQLVTPTSNNRDPMEALPDDGNHPIEESRTSVAHETELKMEQEEATDEPLLEEGVNETSVTRGNAAVPPEGSGDKQAGLYDAADPDSKIYLDLVEDDVSNVYCETCQIVHMTLHEWVSEKCETSRLFTVLSY